MYNVPSVFDGSHKLELLRHSKNFNKKRINQIDVVPEYNLLIILTGILEHRYVTICQFIRQRTFYHVSI